jgi:hypothetical protein
VTISVYIDLILGDTLFTIPPVFSYRTMETPTPMPVTDLDKTLVANLSDKYPERRTQLLNLARFAEGAERFEDMCKIMKAVAHLDNWAKAQGVSGAKTLTVEERNLVSGLDCYRPALYYETYSHCLYFLPVVIGWLQERYLCSSFIMANTSSCFRGGQQ